MGWLSRIFTGSAENRAQEAAAASRERAEEEGRALERWLAALKSEDRTTKGAAEAHLGNAERAVAKGDLAGWQEAREQFELARAVYCRGRAALAQAQPRAAGVLLLADAAAAAAEIRDGEDRSVRAAAVAELQASCGDLAGAKATLADVSEPPDRAGVHRQLAFTRAITEKLAPEELLRELANSETDDWNHDEILLQIVEERCRRADAPGAESMLASIEDPELAAQGLRALALLEARRGRWAEAGALVERIENPHWKSTARCDVVLVQATSGGIENALPLAEGIQDEDVRAIALGGLAAALFEAGNEERAKALLERIAANKQAQDDALTWIAEARARKGDFTGALATIEEISDALQGAQELVTLAELAKAAGKQEIADDFLSRALSEAEALSGNRGFSPVWLARFIVDARARLGQFEGAEAVVDAIGEERERAELLGSLALYQARHAEGGLTALDGLLQRHPGVMERLAILQRGAQGFLVLAQEESAEKQPPSTTRRTPE